MLTKAQSPVPADGVAAVDVSQPGFRRVVLYGVVTGLCPLIPVPFVDDWARDLLKRRMVADLASAYAVDLGDADVKLLASGPSELRPDKLLKGCLLVALIKPVLVIGMKLAKKLFRKILIFLTVRDCVVTASRTFHEGYLVRHAWRREELWAAAGSAGELRRAVDETLEGQDLRPVEKAFGGVLRGSWRSFKAAGRQLARQVRRLRRSGRGDGEAAQELDLAQEEAILGELVDELTRALGEDRGYLLHLREHLADLLASRSAPGTAGAGKDEGKENQQGVDTDPL